MKYSCVYSISLSYGNYIHKNLPLKKIFVKTTWTFFFIIKRCICTLSLFFFLLSFPFFMGKLENIFTRLNFHTLLNFSLEELVELVLKLSFIILSLVEKIKVLVWHVSFFLNLWKKENKRYELKKNPNFRYKYVIFPRV